MAYFLGRDVDVYITTESKAGNDAIGVSGTKGRKLTDAQTGSANELLGIYMFATSLSGGTSVSGGRVKDLTGVDLSIGVSDEDIGPYFGQVATQKAELRKEHTVSLTRKKSSILWDVMFNGPCLSTNYDLDNATAADAAYLGPRWGLVNVSGTDTDDLRAIGNGNFNPKYSPGVSGTAADTPAGPVSLYGYRVHVRLKNGKEVYTVRNCTITGHTVTVNVDGTQEETMELMTTVPARLVTTENTFDVTATPQTEL